MIIKLRIYSSFELYDAQFRFDNIDEIMFKTINCDIIIITLFVHPQYNAPIINIEKRRVQLQKAIRLYRKYR